MSPAQGRGGVRVNGPRRHSKTAARGGLALATLLLLCGLPESSGKDGAASRWELPSATFLFGYDDNVFFVNEGALGKRSSWIAGFDARLAFRPVDPVEFFYAPAPRVFLNESGENYVRHNAGLIFRNREAPGSPAFQTTFTRVEGPDASPIFDAGRHAASSVWVAERRTQWRNESLLSMRWEREGLFLRTRSRLFYLDPDSEERPGVSGFDNYNRRYDMRGGFDLGHAAGDRTEVYLGWHYGRQGQGRQGGRVTDRSNHYHRVFAGVEGKPTDRITLRAEAGPAFHRYDNADSAGPSSLTRLYADATATLQATPRDSVYLTLRRTQWLSGTSPLSLESQIYEASYRRRWDHQWTSRLTVRAQGSDYDGVIRNDWTYTYRVELARHWSDHLTTQLALSREEGRDREGTGDPGRRFDRNSVFTTVEWRF